MDIKFKDIQSTEDDTQGKGLTIMSYNVLAQCYVRSTFYPYCASYALKWKFRSNLLLEQIKKFDPRPNIICIQECDHYYDYWSTVLDSLGYASVYKKKSENRKDGVAIFYDSSIFGIVWSRGIEMNNLVDRYLQENNENADLIERSKRDTVVLVLKLEWRNSNKHTLDGQIKKEENASVIIGTTHLFWDPKQADVKLLQTQVLIDELEKIECNEVPIILCGDFNSLPDSEVYEYITSHKFIKGKKGYANVSFQSAYSLYREEGEPELTTASGTTSDGKVEFYGTLDYIFYDPIRLKPSKLLEIMSLDQATKDVALPSIQQGSDHLPLMCEFRLMQ